MIKETNIIELDGSESDCYKKSMHTKHEFFNADVSYSPLSEMGQFAMLHLNSKHFSLFKSLFEINLNQMTL